MDDLNFKIGDYSIEGKHGYESLKAKGYDEKALAELDTNGDKKYHTKSSGV